MSFLFGGGHNAESLMSGDSMNEPQPKESLLKKSGRIGAILGFAWIALNIVVPLALFGGHDWTGGHALSKVNSL